MISPTLSVIILAGGLSQRMGTDKALLKMDDGQPLLARTLWIARELAESVLVVSGECDRYKLALPFELTAQVHFVQEPTVEGPLKGFARGLEQVNTDWCLLLACDLPYLERDPLQRWWTWLAKNQTHRPASASLIPRVSRPKELRAAAKQWEPLCGFYHRSSLPSLTRHFSNGNSDLSARRHHSFQAWLTSLSITAYTAFPPSMLFNCNTPDDWAKAQQNIF